MADEFDGLGEPCEGGEATRPAPAPTMTEEELAAGRAEYRRLARQNTGRALPAHAANFDELLTLADQLKPADTEGIESVIERGVQMNLNDIQNGRLKITIRDRTNSWTASARAPLEEGGGARGDRERSDSGGSPRD